jgi:hypothetical protein
VVRTPKHATLEMQSKQAFQQLAHDWNSQSRFFIGYWI